MPSNPLPDQSGWPAHLRDDAPYLVCDICGRKTWDTMHEVGTRCEMTQPTGPPCHGHFVSLASDETLVSPEEER